MSKKADWRAAVKVANEKFDAGTAAKKDYMKALQLVAGGIDEEMDEPEAMERYKSAHALRERIFGAFPAESKSEAFALLFSRLAVRGKDPDTALSLIKGMKQMKVRSFLPIIRAYADQGAFEKAEKVYAEHLLPLKAQLDLNQSSDAEARAGIRLLWENVLAARITAWQNWARATANMEKTDDPCDHVSKLQTILKDIVDQQDWLTQSGTLDVALRGACIAAGWDSAEICPNDEGFCATSDTSLRRHLLDEELRKVMTDIDDMVIASIDKQKADNAKGLTEEMLDETRKGWSTFKEQVSKLEERYQIIIDGANIGQQMQNFGDGCFQFRAIDAVLDAHERAGRRAVVVLHSRWRYRETCMLSRDMALEGSPHKRSRISPPQPQADKNDSNSAPSAPGSDPSSSSNLPPRTEVDRAKGWRERGQLIVAPRGINDDNAAMYLAAAMSLRGVPNVEFVTNDFLRDHKRKADFSRPLRMWLDRHVSRYTLKYVGCNDLERYMAEESAADAKFEALDVPEQLVKPDALEGLHFLKKVCLFPPLQYIVSAQGDSNKSIWYFPLGSDWMLPRAKKREADGQQLSSVADASARFARMNPTYLVAWAPRKDTAPETA